VPPEARLPEAADLVVVGAGIIGLSAAWEAMSRGWSVLVIDRDEPGGGASSVAAGMLAPVSEARPTEEPLVRFGRDSLERWPELVGHLERATGIECLFPTGGILLVAVDRDQLEVLEHEERNLEALGLEAERLSGRQVLEREPRLNPSVVGGLSTREDRSVDPRRVVQALVEAIGNGGSRVASGVSMKALHRDDAGVRSVELESDGRIRRVETGRLLVAAGSWSHRVLPELQELPLRPVKGQLIRLRGEPLIERMVRTPDVYLVPRDSGELVVGASSEEQGFDGSATAGVVMDLLYEAWRAVPGLYDLELREINVGFRPALRDNLPAIGPATGISGLYVATGHYRNGILLAPATAHYLVATMETGDVPSELQPFAPDRF